MSKTALVRFKQKSPNPKRFKPPMKVDNVLEVGEGSNFVHIFCVPSPELPILEVNINSADVESVTIVDNQDEAQKEPALVDQNGLPLSSGDEVQADERLPVTQEEAGASPVVPAISDESA